MTTAQQADANQPTPADGQTHRAGRPRPWIGPWLSGAPDPLPAEDSVGLIVLGEIIEASAVAQMRPDASEAIQAEVVGGAISALLADPTVGPAPFVIAGLWPSEPSSLERATLHVFRWYCRWARAILTRSAWSQAGPPPSADPRLAALWRAKHAMLDRHPRIADTPLERIARATLRVRASLDPAAMDAVAERTGPALKSEMERAHGDVLVAIASGSPVPAFVDRAGSWRLSTQGVVDRVRRAATTTAASPKGRRARRGSTGGTLEALMRPAAYAQLTGRPLDESIPATATDGAADGAERAEARDAVQSFVAALDDRERVALRVVLNQETYRSAETDFRLSRSALARATKRLMEKARRYLKGFR